MYCKCRMDTTSRPLRKPKAQSASATAKRDMFRFGGQHIVELLNMKPNPESATERVAWLVEAFHQVIRLHESIQLPSAFGSGSRAAIAEAAKILAEVNARLCRFNLIPVVLQFPTADSRLGVQYQHAESKNMSRQTQTERVAALWLIDHLDTVHRIRRCRLQECQKWFFAVTEHQKYCGDTCRKRDASHGESFKKKRAAYMRKYRGTPAGSTSKRLAKGEGK